MKSRLHTVIKRNGERVAFDRSRIKKAIEKCIRASERMPEEIIGPTVRALTDRSLAILEGEFTNKKPPRVEEIHRRVEQVLFLAGLFTAVERYRIYKNGRGAVRRGEMTEEQFLPDGVPRAKVAEITEWNRIHGCDSIEALNELIRRENRKTPAQLRRELREGTLIFAGDKPRNLLELVITAERAKDEEINRAAELALGKEGLRVIIVAGPSSSGKTTTTRRTCAALTEKTKGKMIFKEFGVDNYFHSLVWYPLIEYLIDGKKERDYDYEDPRAYLLEDLRRHVTSLLAGKAAMCHRYNFQTGISHKRDMRVKLGRNEVLVLDCLHGLSPEVTGFIQREISFKLYIEAMNTADGPDGHLQWTDNRLMRRMLRDMKHRNHPPLDTLMHWHLVRAGEARGIIPYIMTSDVIVNGGYPYELAILKQEIYEKVRELLPVLARNVDLTDAYFRAQRIINLLESVETLKPELWAVYAEPRGIIPGTSLLREFIGGSTVV